MTSLFSTAARRRIATVLLMVTLIQLGLPVVSYALTSGPSQPEFSSFEPVSTNQMVDEFSGDFTYNVPVITVPGPQGSDYPLSLSYHSGASAEEEASWVGYGWTLNPGAINRNTRGFPDDFKNAPVTYWNKMPANITTTAGVSLGLEVFGADKASANIGLRYNNYSGYGYNAGVGLTLGRGVVSIGYGVSDSQGSFSASINPVVNLQKSKENKEEAAKKDNSTSDSKPLDSKKANKQSFHPNRVSLIGGNHGLFTFSEANHSATAANYTGFAFNVSLGFQVNPLPLPAGGTTNVYGSFTWQENVERDQLNAYGYMYSCEADEASSNSKDDAVRDYFTEKETSYNKRDVFLGVPFNNADIFSVSGEGVGGGFRLYHDEVGEFTPNSKTSNVVIGNLSPEISAGGAFGLGSDFGAGWQRFSEGAWEAKDNRGKFSKANGGDDKVFFRFANDMGGQAGALGVLPDEPVSAQLGPNVTGALNKVNLRSQLKQTAAHGRASYIGYHTVDDLYKTAGNNTRTRRPSRFFSHRQDLPVNNAELPLGAICEMSVATASGGQYIYGLPVLAKKEGDLQYGVSGEERTGNHTVSTSKTDKQLAAKVGEERSTAYASSFPLTEIRTPDYVDRTLDGPTQDDFGGYSCFVYDKIYGGTQNNTWYNWRMPYNGLLFHANSLSDKTDDMGTVSYGQKEVVYLQAVRTKTHTAIFILEPRDDSRDAGLETEGPGSPRSREGNSDADPGNRNSLMRLQRIDLYANADVETYARSTTGLTLYKGKPGKSPIKSVHFSYDYTLFSSSTALGLPNAIKNAANKRQGKLTLTRIWFEYNGIPTKISPYTFGYAYPNTTEYPAAYQQSAVTTMPDKLPATTPLSYYNQLSAQVQNPVYDPYCLDAWGSYRKSGVSRANNLQAWVDQKDIDDYDVIDRYNWDPAAWQLKNITLPSGGQIQIQYEQDDYAYVQNKPVHAMVSLADQGENIEGNKFYLDLNGVGITTSQEKEATVTALREQYLTGGNRKIFFKFLYSLNSTSSPTLYPLSRNSEYITGYATVKDVGIEGNDNNSKVYLTLDNSSSYTLPQKVCKNFLLTQRAGKLGGNDFQADKNSPERAVRDLIAWYKTVGLALNQCAGINKSLSYFRVPLVKPKKGGGLRVKRLLTFDKTGLDNKAVLYGSEYSYRMRDAQGRIISSGVATTEPSAMREENILVDFLSRQGQSLASKIVSGIDRKQAEGPLGESLLPAPSVGYSRVVVRNIHSGRTTTGYSISEFATARDYPMQVKYTAMQSTTNFQLQWAFLATNQVNNTYATQGYSFILNNMHGQVIRKATYPGDYPGPEATQLPSPTNEQKYTYYEPAKLTSQGGIMPGDFIPVVTEQGEKPAVNTVNNRIYPGREVDITSAQKAVKDNMLDLNVEGDVDVGVFVLFPVLYITAIPTITRSQAELYTHVTSKVVRYPAVVKRIETTQDGIQHTTENIAFDKFSGQAVQTRASDEFKGGYVQETVQAAWVRPEFGPKWERENLSIHSTSGAMTISLGSSGEVWLNFTGSACSGLSKITRGDHLVINNGDEAICFADAPDFVNNRVRLYPVALPLDVQATALPTGITAGTTVTDLQITSSGRKNQLTAAAGATTYHGSDFLRLDEVGPFTTPSKYGLSRFTTALTTQLQSNTNPTGSFTVSGPYEHMNMTAYNTMLPSSCVKDASDITIYDVVISKHTVNGKAVLSIVSFSVQCDGTSTKVLIQN